jgi:hypothetical protein
MGSPFKAPTPVKQRKAGQDANHGRCFSSGAVGLICRQILADFNKKGPKRGRSSSNSREEILFFPTHTNKKSVFLKPKLLQKVKITGETIFFSQRPNFSSGLAEKF